MAYSPHGSNKSKKDTSGETKTHINLAVIFRSNYSNQKEESEKVKV